VSRQTANEGLCRVVHTYRVDRPRARGDMEEPCTTLHTSTSKMTSATRLHKATRVMKARWPGTCPLCRGPIRRLQQIGKTRVGWCHTTCLTGRTTYTSTP
jgi:hypothetical protein